MHIVARRVFRLSFTTALTLAIAYGIAIPFPFIAPMFAFLLTAIPSLRLNLKKLIGLVLLLALTLSIGLLIIPLINDYTLSGILVVGLGLYLSAYLTVNLGKGMVGTLLGVGFTTIPAAGAIDYALATIIIQSLIIGVSIAVLCQWIVYPFFPEDESVPAKKDIKKNATQSNWIALRFTFIVLPPFLLALINPAIFFKTIIKSLMLGLQGSEVEAKSAGRELMGSTLLGGLFAIIFWTFLKINPNLWMLFLYTLVLCVYFASKIYQVYPSRFSASFWQDVAVTMIILIGLAIIDSDNGSNVYQAFAQRMSVFIGLAFYAWGAIYFLDTLRHRNSAISKKLAMD
ncbi:MAG: DUF2955 domain-containing protein [Pseudomonadota bacterium]